MQILPVSFFKNTNVNLRNLKSNSTYLKPLKADSVQFGATHKGYTGWLEIPSCNKDSLGFYDNTDSLLKFWNGDWDCDCDISNTLLSGDFHIYLDNGKPVMGVKYTDSNANGKDIVQKIFIDREESQVPLRYLDKLKKHIKGHKVSETAENFIDKSFALKNEIKNMFPDGVENYTFEERLNAFGIETALGEDGKLILSEYRQPKDGVKFSDIAIDEDELLKNVSVIMGNADFTNSDATSLGSLESIGGSIVMRNHNVKDIGNLAHIGGERHCDNSDFHVAFEVKYSVW